MVHDDGPVGLDQVRVVFDDERVVSGAGVALAATLAQRLGLEGLVERFVLLRPERPGARNAGRKVMSLVFAMALGADSIDDSEVLRSGRTRRLLGGWVAAPSTLGTFLRAFTFGHVRQLDRVLGEALTRAWRAGAGPGGGRLVVDVDSFIGEVHGYQKQGASFGYTKKRGYHPLLASRADTGEVLHVRLRKGAANTQRGILRFTDELLARVERAGATGVRLLRADSGFWNNKLFARLEKAGWLYSIGVRMTQPVAELVAKIADEDWTKIDGYQDSGDAQIALVEAEHRQHAVVELCIRDLKDQALEHFPSGQFNANAAWTVIACLAHNLLRWTGLLGLPNRTIRAARTLRHRLLALPGRLTSHADHWTLHLLARWPWQEDFGEALTRIRALPAA